MSVVNVLTYLISAAQFPIQFFQKGLESLDNLEKPRKVAGPLDPDLARQDCGCP